MKSEVVKSLSAHSIDIRARNGEFENILKSALHDLSKIASEVHSSLVRIDIHKNRPCDVFNTIIGDISVARGFKAPDIIPTQPCRDAKWPSDKVRDLVICKKVIQLLTNMIDNVRKHGEKGSPHNSAGFTGLVGDAWVWWWVDTDRLVSYEEIELVLVNKVQKIASENRHFYPSLGYLESAHYSVRSLSYDDYFEVRFTIPSLDKILGAS